GKIRLGEVLQGFGIGRHLFLVRRLNEAWIQLNVPRHFQIGQHLLSDSLKYRGSYWPTLMESYRRIDRNEDRHRRIVDGRKPRKRGDEISRRIAPCRRIDLLR